MLKRIIYISLLLLPLSHNAIAEEINVISKDSSNNDGQLLVVTIQESLYSAIEMDSANEIKQFIAFGANFNHRYEGNITPLMVAARLGKVKSVKTLLEHGANTNLISDENKTAFDYAQENKHIPTLLVFNNFNTPEQKQSNKQIITTIQYYLNRLGYVAGNIDGVYGKKTINTLIQFSIDSKQTFAAEVSERQIETLFNVMSGNMITEDKDSSHEIIEKAATFIDKIPTETAEDIAITETGMSLQ